MRDCLVDRIAGVPLAQWSLPAIIAGAFGAAFVVASGAFFVETLFQTPPPAYVPIAVETTGGAPARDKPEPAAAQPKPAEMAASADCQTQTWPHIARPCLSNEQQGTRGVRMITTDKLAEPAISVIEKPPANVIHQMAPPPATRQRASLFAVSTAAPLLSGPALSAIAFAGRFEGTPATEKFELAAAPAAAPQPEQDEAKAEKPIVQKKVAANKPVKQKRRHQLAHAKSKSRSVAATSRPDNAASSSFSSTQSGFPSRGPFGALFGN